MEIRVDAIFEALLFFGERYRRRCCWLKCMMHRTGSFKSHPLADNQVL